jgi:TrmH family RNA methyltransferase
MERIASRQNPLVRRFREAARRERDDTVLLDGAHLLDEALRSHVPIDLVAISDRLTGSPDAALADSAARTGARVVQVSDQVLTAISPVRQPSGIVALATGTPAALDRCLTTNDGSPPLVVIADGIQESGNVGAIVRAAEAAGASAIVCTEGSADPFGWKALRGAMGSTFRMPIAVRQPWPAVVEALRLRGLGLVATVAHDGVAMQDCDFRQPMAILLGAEGPGLSADRLAAASIRVTIRMKPPVESLNVGIAAALILVEAARQRGFGTVL